MSTTEALKRARRGAKFLDKTLGRGWRRKIRRRKLDMSCGDYETEGCGCILAQLAPDGTYSGGLEMVGLEWPRDESLGFDRDDGVEYDDLDEAWLEVLREKAPS